MTRLTDACKPGQPCEIMRLVLPARDGCPLCPWLPVSPSAPWVPMAPPGGMEAYRAARVERSHSAGPLADTSHHTPEYLAELDAAQDESARCAKEWQRQAVRDGSLD